MTIQPKPDNSQKKLVVHKADMEQTMVLNPNTYKAENRKRQLIRTMAISLGTGLLITACGNHESAEEYLAKAKQQLEKKDARAAVIELRNSLKKNPDTAEARFLLGKSYLAAGNPQGAEIELRKALSLKFDGDQTIPELARTMLALNKAQELLLEFEGQKLKSANAQADLLTSIGNAYRITSKPEKAKESFLEAQKVKPDYIEAILGEARILAINKDFSAAEARVNAALEINPKSASSLLAMGDLDRIQNRLDKAVAHYQAASANEPDNFAAHLALADTYLAQDNIDGLRTQLLTLKKTSATSPVVNYLDALSAAHDKKYKEAKEAIQKSLASAPDNPQSLLLAGIIEQRMNEPAQSESHFKQVLVKSPNNLVARKQLATLYIQQKELSKAEVLLKPALTAFPDDTELLNLSGDIAIAKGDFGEASRLYGRASELSPTNSNSLTQSAIAQLASGNSALGLSKLEAASAMDQSNARADAALVLIYLDKKNYDQAFKSWQTLQKKQPDNPLTYNLEAGIFLAKGDFSGARKALEQAATLQPTYYPAAANLANLDLRDKKPDAAKQRYRTLLEKDKTNMLAMLELAKLERATGAPKASVLALLNQAIDTHPEAVQPIVALTGYYLESGDPKQALATATAGLTKIPKNPQLMDLVGLAQMQTGEAEQAVDTYTQMVNDSPKQPALLLRLGSAQIDAGRMEAAFQSMTRALELDHDSIDLQAATVTAFLHAGKPDDASRMLAQVVKLAPKSPALPDLTVRVQMAKGEFPAAIATYKKNFSTIPVLGNLVKLHKALIQAGNQAEADSLLNNWVSSHANDDGTLFYAAESALVRKDYTKADALYRTLLNKKPDNVLALNNIAWANLELKNDKALEYAEKAYQLAPDNPGIQDTLGWILSEQGQTKRGIELLEKAVASAPQQNDIKLHLAKVLIKDGRKDVARTQLSSIVKAAPTSDAGKESAQLLTTL